MIGLGVTLVLAWAAFDARREHVEGLRSSLNNDRDGDGLVAELDADADGDGVPWTRDPDSDGDGLGDADDIVVAAREMIGEPADPLMGRYGDPLRSLGFRVCIDVVLDAWLEAGRPLAAELVSAGRTAPAWFSLGPDNPVAGVFFVRRTRNLRDWFAHDPALEIRTDPAPGDVVFWGRWHSAVVVEAGLGWRVVEARGMWIAERAGDEVSVETGERPVFGNLRRL